MVKECLLSQTLFNNVCFISNNYDMQCFIRNHDLCDGKVGDMMLLGRESNTSIWQKSAKLEGGNLSLGGGKSLVPHPLYETL